MIKKYFLPFVCFLILIVSLHDIKVIPFYKEPGLDFSNNYGFHHCEPGPLSIYKIDPSKCADFEARPYVYPPLLYQLFSWTRMFDSSASAYWFFIFLHLASFLLVVYIWTEKNLLSLLFGLGLFFTYPNLFLFERGNSDMLIVLFWSLSYLAYKKNQYNLTGFLLAVSLFSKLYPIYSVLILFAFFYDKTNERNQILKSSILTGLGIFLISPFLWIEYVFTVLPAWSGIKLPIFNLAHSFKSIPGSGIGTIVFALVLLFWIVAARKSSRQRLGWIWAGGLAISTFNNGVSYDYNLVTIFPLAMLGFNQLTRESNNKFLALSFIVLFFTVFGFRDILSHFSVYPLARLWLIALSLLIIPFVLFDLSSEKRRMVYFFKTLRFNH